MTHIAVYHMHYQAINYEVHFVLMPLFTLILKAHLTTKYEIIYQILKWKNQITALFEVHSYVKKKMLCIMAGTNLSLGSSEWVLVITRTGG